MSKLSEYSALSFYSEFGYFYLAINNEVTEIHAAIFPRRTETSFYQGHFHNCFADTLTLHETLTRTALTNILTVSAKLMRCDLTWNHFQYRYQNALETRLLSLVGKRYDFAGNFGPPLTLIYLIRVLT